MEPRGDRMGRAALALTKAHPSGFRPKILDRSTMHIGGLVAGTSSSCSYSYDPWGTADTVIDELTVYPGALGAAQIAQLAGRQVEVRELTGPPKQPPVIDVPKLRQAPTIDGRLSEGEWNGAASLPTLIDATEPGASFDYPPVRTHIAYDDENLYLAMRSEFPFGASIPKGGTRAGFDETDEQVWDDESFEFWLIKDGDEQFMRFAGNVAGGFTEMHGKDRTWNGRWTCRSFVETII